MSDPNKDLFRALFARVSKHSFETYRESFLKRLPSLLLEAALQSAPEVADCEGFSELRERLHAPERQPQTWKNAELYPYLNYLAFPQNSKRQLCINALRAHCRLDPLTAVTNPDVRYWRLVGKSSVGQVDVVSFANQSAGHRRDLGWPLGVPGGQICVYRPHDRLFDDVEPCLYGAQATLKSNEELDWLLLQALSIIDQYSRDLHQNIIGQLSAISLLKEVNGRPISYSLRNRFIGGIFVTITSPAEMAEQIIHEYYHQCLWPWWLIEPPEDLPDAELRVTSPVTGAARSLATMIQAVLIYASLLDFYTFAKTKGLTGPDKAARNRAAQRALVIRTRYDNLASGVLEELERRPASQALVGTILELRNEAMAHRAEWERPA